MSGKKFGLIAVIMFFIFVIWMLTLLTIIYFTRPEIFKFDFFISILTHMVTVIITIWGAVFGKNIIDNKFNNQMPINQSINSPVMPK
jgi:glucan phosphoethanolaminetransferase (alkaline phosphatase superfamily)